MVANAKPPMAKGEWAKFKFDMKRKNPLNYGMKLTLPGLYHYVVGIFGDSARDMDYGVLMKIWNLRCRYAKIRNTVGLDQFLRNLAGLGPVFKKLGGGKAWRKYGYPD